MNHRYGISLKNLIDAAKKYESVDLCASREKILVYICKNLLRSLQYTQTINNVSAQAKMFSNATLNTTVSGADDAKSISSAKKAANFKQSYFSSRRDLNEMFFMLNNDNNNYPGITTTTATNESSIER